MIIRGASRTTKQAALKKPAKRKQAVLKTKGAKQKGKLGELINSVMVTRIAMLVSGLGISLAVVWWLHSQPDSEPVQWMPMRYLEIQGEHSQVSKDAILQQLIRQPDTGYLSTDLAAMEKNIESLPWVYNAELRRVWPDKLQLAITEQVAIAKWNDDRLVNKYGELFKPESIDVTLAVPQLYGPEEELKTLLKTYQKVQKLFAGLELQVQSLSLDYRRAWQLTLNNGIELKVGREHLLTRIKRFVDLYPMLAQESSASIAAVDLRYDTGLAVTRNQVVADK